MFKTDKESLEKISFEFNEQEIANLRKLIEIIRQRDLNSSSIKELNRLTKGLDEIGRLKLDGRYYAFHVSDAWVERISDYRGAGSGIEVYLRQGDRLEEFMTHPTRERCYDVDEVVKRLKEKNISTVYTGYMESDFLGLPQREDEDDPIERRALEDFDITNFESLGIKVVWLDSLI